MEPLKYHVHADGILLEQNQPKILKDTTPIQKKMFSLARD